MKILRFFFLSVLIVAVLFAKAERTGDEKDSVKLKKPAPVDLLNANSELQKTKNTIVAVEEEISKHTSDINVDSAFNSFYKFLKNEARGVNQLDVTSVSDFYLENELRSWREYKIKVTNTIASLRKILSVYQKNLNRLAYEQKVWQLTLESFRGKTDVPAGLVSNIKNTLAQLSKTKNVLEKKQKRLLVEENGLTDLLILIENSIDRLTQLGRELRSNLLVRNGPPLWNVGVNAKEIVPAGQYTSKVLEDNRKSIYNYFKQRNFGWILLVLLLEVALFLFVKTRYNKLNLDENEPGYVNADFILNKKGLPSLMVLLLLTVLIFLQNIPLSLSTFIVVILLLFSLPVVYRFAGTRGKKQTAIILLLFVINEFEVVLWYSGDLLRYYVVLEDVAGMLLAYYLLGFKWKRTAKEASFFVKTVIVFSYGTFALYFVSFFANLFGWVHLSFFLTKAAVKIPAVFLFVFFLYKTLEVLIGAGCKAGKSFRWNIYDYCDNIEKALLRVLKLVSYYFLAELLLKTLDIYYPVYNWIKFALVYPIVIGTFTITAGRIFGMIIIIVVSYFVANIFNVLFQNSAYVNKNLSKGFVFAINKTVGYTIIIVGFLLGFAYAGLDLGKFSLLAGALGVGIGFGLQNIVNNFISGLILLYERPVNVGDVISVGNLMGEVKSIGVRASKIRSFDGAEVVVPNGNIISNDLINWTLSDKKRRIEIKVGAAYGTDPNQVLKILQKVAVNNDNVLPDPPPLALFEGFGDSSLDFRLLAWVFFERSFITRSELSVAVYNALNEAGIEIPFPQMDVHIKKEPLTQKPEVVMPKMPDNPNVTVSKPNQEEKGFEPVADGDGGE